MPQRSKSPLEQLQEWFGGAASADAQAIEAQAVAMARPHRAVPEPPELQGEETTGEAIERNVVSGAEAFTSAAPEVAKGIGKMLVSPFPGALEMPARVRELINYAKTGQYTAPTAGEAVAGVSGISPERVGRRLAENDYGGVIGEAAPAVAALLAGGKLLRRLSPAELQAPVSPEVTKLRQMFNKPAAEVAEPRPVGAAVAKVEEVPAGTEQPAAATPETVVPRVGEVSAPREAPDFAANVNLSKLETGADVKEVIRQTAEAYKPELEKQGRGVRTHAQTQAVAEQLGLTPDDLKKFEPGQAANAETLLAMRRLNVASAENVRNAVQAFKAVDSSENLLAVQAAVQQHVAVLKSVSGATAEAGRALNQFRIMAKALREKSNYEKVLDELGGREVNAELARKLAQIPEDDIVGLNNFLRNATEFSTADKISAYWTANILSGPRTHVRNLAGNTLFALVQFPQRFVRGMIDAPLSKLTGRPREYFASETIPAAVGYMAGLPDGLRRAAFIIRNGFDMADAAANKLEQPKMYSFPGGAANPWNWPGRYLVAADAMAKTQALTSELYALATRQAIREKLRGSALLERVGELLKTPPKEMVEKATEFSRYTTFNTKPDAFARGAIFLREVKLPGTEFRPLRFVIPFVNTPWNILKTGLAYSPVGVGKLLQVGIRSPEAADILAKSVIGSTAMAGLASLAVNDRLTGAAPTAPAERDAYFRAGKQPYSVKIGNRWIQYNQTTGPLAMAMAAVAAFHDSFAKKGDIGTFDRISQAAAVIGNAVIDQSFFKGLENLFDAVTDDKKAAKFTGDMLTGFVPLSGAQRNVAQALDPRVLDAQTMYERVAAGVPLLSKKVPSKLDVFGREQIMRGGEGALAFLPSRIPTDEARSSVDVELNRLGIYPGKSGSALTLANVPVTLSREQQRDLQVKTGEIMYAKLAQVFSSDIYRNMNDEMKQQMAKLLIDAARDAGRDLFLLGVSQRHEVLKRKVK